MSARLKVLRRRLDDLWDYYDHLERAEWPEEARAEYGAAFDAYWDEWWKQRRRQERRKAERLARGATWADKPAST